MKKISLKNLNIIEVEQLSREQLKDVLGGYAAAKTTTKCIQGVGKCSSDCPCLNADDWCVNGSCAKRPIN